LDWSLSHAKASVEPKSVADLVGKQTALNTTFGDKLRAGRKSSRKLPPKRKVPSASGSTTPARKFPSP